MFRYIRNLFAGKPGTGIPEEGTITDWRTWLSEGSLEQQAFRWEVYRSVIRATRPKGSPGNVYY